MGNKKNRNKNKKLQTKSLPPTAEKFSDLLPEPEDFPLELLMPLVASENAIRFVSYNITFEPIEWGYSEELKDRLGELRDMIRVKPQEAITKLLVLKEQYPDIPVICNHLACAYQAIGDNENMEFWTRENYRLHPNYLFARINLAQLYLNKNQLDEFEKVFDHKLELKALYPDRDTFHIKEVESFYTLLFDFCMRKQQLQHAVPIYKLLKSLIPDHPKLARAKSALQSALLLFSTQRILAKNGRDFLGIPPLSDEDHKK